MGVQSILLRGLLLLFTLSGGPRLVTRLMLDRRVPLRLKIAIPAAILYLVSPLDLIPDILPITGHSDDILVIIFSLALLIGMTPRAVVSEHLRNIKTGAGKGSQSHTSQSDKAVIDGTYRIVEDEEQDR